MSFSIGFFVLLVGASVLTLLVSRRTSRSAERAIKAQQDLARGVADVADQMERLDKKLGRQEQAKP